MSAAPSDALQVAQVKTLTADAGVYAAFGCAPRVYDEPPDYHIGSGGQRIAGPPFPYITTGEVQLIKLPRICGKQRWEAFVTTHVWSRSGRNGKREAKRIGDAVDPALDTQLSVDGFTCSDFEFRDARYFYEPDRLTAHGVIVHRFVLDPEE